MAEFIRAIETYACDSCGHSCDYARLGRSGDGEVCCPICYGGDVTFKAERQARWSSVAVYEVSRAFGGPEEGGWYYDRGTRDDATVRAFEPGDFPQIDTYVDMLRRRFKGRGYTVRVYDETLPPVHFPEQRPTYS